jgi:hypothetical protein
VNLNYNEVFAWTLILIIIAVSIEGLVIKYQKRLWDT